MTVDPIITAIDETTQAIRTHPYARWLLGFSGGKDSSAALKVFIAAYRKAGISALDVTVLYCDTGVENVILDNYVKDLFSNIKAEFLRVGLPFKTEILRAPIQDRFFVRIIGRGYPPPTNSFRWCTNSLRVRPVSSFIESQNIDNTIVVLGLRKGESQQRDRSFGRAPQLYWQRQREGRGQYNLFFPIVELDVSEVWDAVFWLPLPASMDPRRLETLYRGASGECPVVKSPQAPPCASGRFGCWTCTVVRKDKSARELIRSGHTELIPFLEFRDWIAEFRNDPRNRWPSKRSGASGLGPFSIDARKRILRKVDQLEDRVGHSIIDQEERGLIASLWRLDHLPRLSFRLAEQKPART